jgi:hypothetical protein
MCSAGVHSLTARFALAAALSLLCVGSAASANAEACERLQEAPAPVRDPRGHDTLVDIAIEVTESAFEGHESSPEPDSVAAPTSASSVAPPASQRAIRDDEQAGRPCSFVDSALARGPPA